MIGQAWPVPGTGYSVLEEGQIDRATLGMVVAGYWVATPRGDTWPTLYPDRACAEAAVHAHLAASSPS